MTSEKEIRETIQFEVNQYNDKSKKVLYIDLIYNLQEYCKSLQIEARTEALSQHDVSEMLPLDFIKWYSGMEEEQVKRAYERWKIESGNLR